MGLEYQNPSQGTLLRRRRLGNTKLQIFSPNFQGYDKEKVQMTVQGKKVDFVNEIDLTYLGIDSYPTIKVVVTWGIIFNYFK